MNNFEFMYYMNHPTQMQAWLSLTESWQAPLWLKQELFDATKSAKQFDFPSASPSICLWAIPEFCREVEVPLPNSSLPCIFPVFSAVAEAASSNFYENKVN